MSGEAKGKKKEKPPKIIDAKYFGNLKVAVIDKGICSHCSTCATACPAKGITTEGVIDFPNWEEDCTDCGFCIRVCPRWDYRPLNGLGEYIEIFAAKSNRFSGQDGGMVTEILASAMEMGIIEAAAVVRRDEEWKPAAFVAKSVEELVQASGTKYSYADVLPALRKAGKVSAAIVGTPCMVSGARKLQQNFAKYRNNIRLVVGLFCTENFYYEDLRRFLESKGIDISRVEKMDIKKGKFIVSPQGVSFPVKEMDEIVPSGCKVCQDFAAVESDVSIGSVGASDGFSAVIVRSEVAKQIVDYIREKGYATFEDAKVELIEKLVNFKIKIHPYP
ncbi:Coenzyme F420 hydrogenase/dehydrogenase, beta subunit C-terminal domain [Archaeoglobus veneficus]|uniref:Coenzyme F420 hydrogenase n=1 Tax=Archaeoglobus veneficus (strain DSM 11195 / SNP6) TaxID=693661 RepID=F2KQC4_ARCVS|nr:Coenzyme F420 hydrogenase/dehydrogenase, beta subunit C-terminal domain [Archaeoglobus veneficus]AEA46557.1 Coenzyme F420 hydrogenase [Archaeoglobus veneficus SNP6]